MIKPDLIQRAVFYKKEGKGIDSILRFDYMGSSEFEWGALPKSLKRVRANLGEYVQFQYSFKNFPEKTVTVLCTKEQQGFVGDILEGLVERKFRLKEFCDLNGYVDPKENSYNKSDFWWDIEHDWFFWKSNPEFDVEFRKALDPV
jgi:hypothetical protein